MSDTKATPKKATRRTRPRPASAVQFTVWSATGGPLPEDAVKKIAEAIELATFELFNDGIRVLTQTTRG